MIKLISACEKESIIFIWDEFHGLCVCKKHGSEFSISRVVLSFKAQTAVGVLNFYSVSFSVSTAQFFFVAVN